MKKSPLMSRSGASLFVGLVGLMLSQGLAAQNTPGVSEKDFLDEMPIILSVSRLPQRLDETPGAVTILDRDFIRSSGARDVADLLRLVPGFQSSTSFEGDAPQASYHGVYGYYSARIQVLVDGRSVYSNYFAGSVAPGLMSVMLDDIERIEVLRGSNSVAYGARAMLGVVNIVTRHSAETLGPRAALTRGENGIQDTALGLGWRTDNSTQRLAVDERGDDGLSGANGHNRVQRANFRSDWQVSGSSQVQLSAGWMAIGAGKGYPDRPGSGFRDTTFENKFLQLDWREVLSPDQDLTLSLSHNQESYHDVVPYLPIPGLNLDGSGTTSNNTLTAQHTLRLSPALRMVWGAELRRESVTSRPLFNTDEALIDNFTRLFTHAEWRLRPDLLLNGGVMAERSSANGSSLAPRLMLNWHVTPEQTLRAGMTRSFRPPSAFERRADVRYSFKNKLLDVTFLASGNVVPETVLTRELGYLGTFPSLKSTLDVRLFDEKFTGFIDGIRYLTKVGGKVYAPYDYSNVDNFSIRGLELQWTGRPWPGAQLGVNQSLTRLAFEKPPSETKLVVAMPKSTSTVFLTQQLPAGLQFSLSHQYSEPLWVQRSGDLRQYLHRTDWRLSKSLRLGQRHGELALTVQNQGSPYADYDDAFLFKRRAFVTLRIDN
ncbi:TonB-dependent receptor plug domain-containing protein [Rhodoferax sp.]|uniref:TonB-dependent receptor plug domain-containing protein n=3 Tax=Rhodoferax sp. TaxID=50421 RepID=UPI002719A098|nr:TonB-dependent receptor [Rhodoferax sp.]MDO9145427.1 TonB-dependent receptor [Rhodoferax sp.]MDP1530979.1 TonB-dependent receptor [Rhodoferax sp.]MDP1942555.1 TonB-dependent receptor [Rhodoferax sp.]MDP2440310.1 TonB-dependent receptor [Rhodoferax sp.]MDP3193254.1 TonB-dependent receptor [Rhodoferax sp.]